MCHSLEQRTKIISKFKENSILAVFHYLSLHKSPYYKSKYKGYELKESDKYSDCLLRLPFYNELSLSEVKLITNIINEFYKNI